MKPLPLLAMGANGLSVWSLPLPARPRAHGHPSRAGLEWEGGAPSGVCALLLALLL